MSAEEAPLSWARYEDVKRRRNAVSEVVTRLLLAGETDLAKELAETDWRPLNKEFHRLLHEDTEGPHE